MRSFLLNLVFVCLCIVAKSQNIGIGADAIYNFQTESAAAGVRINIFPNNRLSIVPQFSYYFPFNKITEYYAGLGLEYKILRRDRINFYAIAQGAYNAWLNYKDSGYKNAQLNNWNFEGGIGVTNNKCLRPFLEYRYNLKFRETQLHLGILYIFGCNTSKSSNNDRCPAY